MTEFQSNGVRAADTAIFTRENRRKIRDPRILTSRKVRASPGWYLDFDHVAPQHPVLSG
jgi:hypothetical protein